MVPYLYLMYEMKRTSKCTALGVNWPAENTRIAFFSSYQIWLEECSVVKLKLDLEKDHHHKAPDHDSLPLLCTYTPKFGLKGGFCYLLCKYPL